MRALLILIFALIAPIAAQAQPKPAAKPPAAVATAAPKPPTPKPIGAFDDWQAATYDEGGQTVCYAFTKARASVPKIPGREAILTVTHRVGMRDAVSISAGFEFAQAAEVEVSADKAKFQFYTAKRSAFARDGHAAIAAFGGVKQVTAKSPHPQKKEVLDTFSTKGFGAAYAAINKACPK